MSKKLKENNRVSICINNINLNSRLCEEKHKKIKKNNKIKTNQKVSFRIESVFNLRSTSTSETLSMAGFELGVVSLTAVVGYGIASGNKLAGEISEKKREPLI